MHFSFQEHDFLSRPLSFWKCRACSLDNEVLVVCLLWVKYSDDKGLLLGGLPPWVLLSPVPNLDSLACQSLYFSINKMGIMIFSGWTGHTEGLESLVTQPSNLDVDASLSMGLPPAPPPQVSDLWLGQPSAAQQASHCLLTICLSVSPNNPSA